MIARKNNNQEHIERTEREFIYLLLSDLEQVKRWTESDLEIDYFEEEHQVILREILKAYDEGYLLTCKTFKDSLKDNPIPKDRISLELAFNLCSSAKGFNGDYIALEKRIKRFQEHKIRSQVLGEWDAEEIRNMSNEEISEFLHDSANKISKTKPSNNKDITNLLEPYLEFPVDAMPTILQPIITEGSLAYTCPKDYIGVSLLTTLAGCIGRAYQLKIKNTWIESTAIWSILIGKPSTVKSSFLRDISKIIYQKEYEWNINFDHNKKEYERKKHIYDKALANWKKEKNSKEDPPEKPTEPVQKCVIASDTTVEAIVQRMKENPKGLTIVMDEIAGFFGGMNRYNMGNNESEFYIQTWSGGSFKVDRKSTGITVIQDMYLSLCGTIQPVRFRGRTVLAHSYSNSLCCSYCYQTDGATLSAGGESISQFLLNGDNDSSYLIHNVEKLIPYCIHILNTVLRTNILIDYDFLNAEYKRHNFNRLLMLTTSDISRVNSQLVKNIDISLNLNGNMTEEETYGVLSQRISYLSWMVSEKDKFIKSIVDVVQGDICKAIEILGWSHSCARAVGEDVITLKHLNRALHLLQ